jgi:hypothetical protein
VRGERLVWSNPFHRQGDWGAEGLGLSWIKWQPGAFHTGLYWFIELQRPKAFFLIPSCFEEQGQIKPKLMFGWTWFCPLWAEFSAHEDLWGCVWSLISNQSLSQILNQYNWIPIELRKLRIWPMCTCMYITRNILWGQSNCRDDHKSPFVTLIFFWRGHIRQGFCNGLNGKLYVYVYVYMCIYVYTHIY